MEMSGAFTLSSAEGGFSPMGLTSRRIYSFIAIALALALAGITSSFWARAAGAPAKVTAPLSGSEQVPAVQTKGTGQFQGTINDSKSISYRLTFSSLSSPVTAAHIHLGKSGTNGGVVAFLCGGGGKPTCPPGGGTVSGTITGANVVVTEGMQKGDLPALIKAIMDGDTYVNVHTTKYKDGEIRGQIQASKY
jgi:hypothetical protein